MASYTTVVPGTTYTIPVGQVRIYEVGPSVDLTASSAATNVLAYSQSTAEQVQNNTATWTTTFTAQDNPAVAMTRTTTTGLFFRVSAGAAAVTLVTAPGSAPTSPWAQEILAASGTVTGILTVGGEVLTSETTESLTITTGVAAHDVQLTNNSADQLIVSSTADGQGNGKVACGSVAATTLTGALTGNVTGNLTGNVTGNVTGNLTGNATGALNGVLGGVTPAAATVTSLNAGSGTIQTTGQVQASAVQAPTFEDGGDFSVSGGAISGASLNVGAGAITGGATTVTALTATGNVRLGNATSDTVGAYDVAGVARPSAFTQTYATATKTQSNLTSATLTDSTGGTPGTTLAAMVGAVYATDSPALFNALASLAAQVNALRVDLVNVKGISNAVIDDLQSEGWLA